MGENNPYSFLKINSKNQIQNCSTSDHLYMNQISGQVIKDLNQTRLNN